MRSSRIAILALTVVLCSGSAIAADFVAHCVGAQEVPARATRAQGHLVLRLSEDGESLHYQLMVANIENVVAAHLHLAPAGVNGPVVVNLFLGGTPGSGRVSGILAEGTATADLFAGPLAGMPMSALLAELEAGNIYANVHTNDGVDPTNTGPGDFPGGEVRGQVRVVVD